MLTTFFGPGRGPARPRLESLEARDVPATFTIEQDVLTVRGTAGPDNIVIVSTADRRMEVWANPPGRSDGTFQRVANLTAERARTLRAITVYGDAGNDTIEVRPNVTKWTSLQGGAGNDTLRGGAWDNYLYGGAGDDTLYGGPMGDRLYGEDGADVLYGGAGDDTLDGGRMGDILYGGAGNDMMTGGTGSDYLDGGLGYDRHRERGLNEVSGDRQYVSMETFEVGW